LPVCHGSGGFAGHYAFGGRTGGSVVLYGVFFLVAGLFFSGGFAGWSRLFPLPVLGVLLLVEGWTMLTLVRDQAERRTEFMIAVLTGLLAGGLPYGYVVGIIVGTVLFYTARKGWVQV
jgi:MFS superfamily sulfate permease-like transporter